MGMLDRLLGDLVASSTNLPPHVTRGLVRRAGGSKLLIAGGAALAGAMIAQHLGARQAQGAQPAMPPPPPGAPPASPPGPATPLTGFAPPPLPGTPAAPQTSPGWAPPPPPAADLGWAPPPLPPDLAAASPASEEVEEAGELDLPPGLLFPIVRAMVAAALADGELEPDEREAIFAHLESGELSGAEVQQVRRDLVLPATPPELAAMVEETEHRELLYRFAFLVLRADGALESPEEAWLDRLAESLAIDAAGCARLQAEVGGDAP